MPKLSEMQQIVAPKILLYGDVRTGKTAWAMTGGECVQVIDLDRGYLTGLRLIDKWTDERKKVDIIECHEDDPKKALAFGKCSKTLNDISEQCLKGTYPFKVLVLDSVTSMTEYCMRQVMAMSGGFAKERVVEHYQCAISQMQPLLVLLRSLPIVVILVGHAKQKVAKDKSEKTTLGVFGNVLPQEILTYIDNIFYSKLIYGPGGKVEYKMTTKGTPMLIAGSRLYQGDDIDMNLGLRDTLGKMGYAL